MEYPKAIEYSEENIRILPRILKQKNCGVDEEDNMLHDSYDDNHRPNG